MGRSEPAEPRTAMPSSGLPSAALVRGILAVLGARPGATSGLEGLGAAFERAGLGEVFRSWVGPGPNLPVTAAELVRALGEPAAGLAALAGTRGAELTAALARRLPEVVDRLTPAGTLPPGGVDLKALAACLRR